MSLTKSGSSTDPIDFSNAMKRCILALKSFLATLGDNTMKDWTGLTPDDFEEFLSTDTGPRTTTTTAPTPAPLDVTTTTNAMSTAMLVKPPTSHADLFMKNKGTLMN